LLDDIRTIMAVLTLIATGYGVLLVALGICKLKNKLKEKTLSNDLYEYANKMQAKSSKRNESYPPDHIIVQGVICVLATLAALYLLYAWTV